MQCRLAEHLNDILWDCVKVNVISEAINSKVSGDCNAVELLQ